MYITYLKDWIDVVPPKQLLIIQSERYYENPIETMKNVTRFLGLGNGRWASYIVRCLVELELSKVSCFNIKFQIHSQTLCKTS